MNHEPYTSPKSDIEKCDPIDMSESIPNKIRNAWLAGLISIGVTIFFTIISMVGGTEITGFDPSALFDVGLMAIFIYGVYKNSRI